MPFTQEQHREEKVVVVEPLAVQMVWRWYCIRIMRPAETPPDPLLFSYTKSSRKKTLLSAATLLSFLHIVARESFLEPHWTGKCFRIGATSDLHAAGTEPAGLRSLGRWRTNIWQTYADQRSHIERAIAIRSIKK